MFPIVTTTGGMNKDKSLFEHIDSLPKPLPFLIGNFAFTADDKICLESYSFGIESYFVDPPTPPRNLGSEPFLYESVRFSQHRNTYPRLDNLSPQAKTVVVSHTFRRGSVPYQRGSVKILDRHFQWIVKRWPKVNWRQAIQERYNHFYFVDWTDSEIFGHNHRNRFIRGTKVLITDGHFQGRHAVVIGHHPNWNLSWPSPRLNLLLAGGVISTVHQYSVQLLDPHGYLPFALPFDNTFSVSAWHQGSEPRFVSNQLVVYSGVRPIDPLDIDPEFLEPPDYQEACKRARIASI